ncbi:superoxide dismutase, Ni [Marinobacterium lutimaris]|uniref:Nickel superoxide dismutase n=1 Tax=Marinobacterium lutimaris TaxID=568106 RepID=A0A1H5VG02_9GAMM|nr:superoxide dismutase, Ni [Marinobacterium lutimaris]SEF86144.1 nickel superoxide dismutase [Marinobacterium lutimaris]
MLHNLLAKMDTLVGFEEASAHCDIPCKIYDPATAQIAALTVIRLVDLLEELKSAPADVNTMAKVSRLAKEKEAHGLIVKEEIRVIWGDYFKQPQIEKFPQIHELTHNIMLAASKAKQEINRDDAVKLLELVNQFAEIFWETKGVATFRAKCPYLPEEITVYPQLTPEA